MHVRVVTLKYDCGLAGFPEAALSAAEGGGALLEVREHFFVHEGVPHLACVLLLDEARAGASAAGRPRPYSPDEDVEALVPEPQRDLYRVLRRWRNEAAKKEGIPSYVIMRNRQLAEICRRLPHSLAELKEIDGIGEATCAKYGRDVLALIPDGAAPAAAPEAAKEESGA